MANSNLAEDISIVRERTFFLAQSGLTIGNLMKGLRESGLFLDTEKKGTLQRNLQKIVDNIVENGGILDSEKIKNEILKSVPKNIPVSDAAKIGLIQGIASFKQSISNLIDTNPGYVKETREISIENKLQQGFKKDSQYQQIQPIATEFSKKIAKSIAETEISQTEKDSIVEQSKEPIKSKKALDTAQSLIAIAKLSPNERREMMALREKLEGHLPYEADEQVGPYIQTLDSIKNNPEIEKYLNKIQSQPITEISQGIKFVVGKVRQETMGVFLKDATSAIQLGGNEGIKQVLMGIAKGSMPNVSGIVGAFKNIVGILKGGTAAITGAATAGLSFLAIGAKKVLTKLGDFAKGILKDIGLSFSTGIGKFLDTIPVIGTTLNKLVIENVENAARSVVFILIAVFGGVIVFGWFIQSLITSVAPIQQTILNIDLSETCVNKTGYPSKIDTYIKNGLTFYVFEPNNNGGRLTQAYDLGVTAPGELGNVSGYQLDIRVIEAYKKMVADAQKSGKLSKSNDLTLTSGYRSTQRQEQLWNQAKIQYGSEEAANKFVAKPGCSPHQTGRAVDIYVNGTAGITTESSINAQKASSTYLWLKDNAANYGFYNYLVEPWHWEYNPPPQIK